MDVRHLLRRAANHNSWRDAIVSGDTTLQFEDAWQRGISLANGLLTSGLQPGDRVGTLSENGIPASDFLLGTAIAGLVRVPLYARNSPDAHRHMLSHTRCKSLLTTERHRSEIDNVIGELPDIESVITADSGYETWISNQDKRDPEPSIRPSDTYIIRHTSGTTGLPKGVPYSHRSWLATGRDRFYNWPPVQPGDRCLHVAPISHGSGYLFGPIWATGGCNIMVDHFDPSQVLQLLEAESISYVFMVPTMLRDLVDAAEQSDISFPNLKVVDIGGAPITRETAYRARDLFGMVLHQHYGQTEAVPLTTMGPEEWFSDVPGSDPMSSAGRPLPTADVRIVDSENREVPTGDIGEISIQCDGQFSGYWENEEATESTIRDGWVLTGDIGRIDGNGYIYLLDRKHDMIISGGFNIWPAELERVITEVDGIADVAVIGVPDQRWGESPVAICVLEEGSSVTESQVVQACRDRLGSYKKPRQVIFREDPLPRSAVGKVERKQLREPFWSHSDSRVAGN
jgi:acyl-CoA synthetase (AMP-forming)/AMP-acid ligase II